MLIREKILDLFFPRQCLGCNKDNELVCSDCLKKIKINPDISNSYFVTDYTDGVWVISDFNDPLLQKIIYHFKYRFVRELGLSLEIILEQYLTRLILNQALPKIDLVVPMPISKKRLLFRGFNQADMLAATVARQADINFENNILIRKNREPQVGNDALERRQNIKNVFSLIDAQAVKGKRVLVIDDVLTTGSTIDELSRVLKQAGAKRVWALVIAKN
ncbi:MAG: ComF family protein [Candidatus Buchananbacteria bacterium]|nr:ComF family protein [Candidatus Buchananbacteria bacterium]